MILLNPLDYITMQSLNFLNLELTINLLMLFFQPLRFFNFKNIRKIREILDEILITMLTKIENKFEKILDLKLNEFKINRDRLLKYLQRWSDLYLGSLFIGLKKQILISDFNNFMYTLKDEEYYFKLFNELKFRLKEGQFFNSRPESENIKHELEDPIYDLIDLNIKRLTINIQSKRSIKNEQRNKIRIIQTWIAIISITLSIIFSILKLPTLIGGL